MFFFRINCTPWILLKNTQTSKPISTLKHLIKHSKMSSKPLVTHIFTADPSAHVFNDKIYIYPSHDVQTDIQDNDNGDQYAMNDYHVLSLDSVGGPVTDHGVALALADIPWAGKQLWAPDAATKNGKYYLYFPARDKENVFRIGVAVSDVPEGPFKPEPKPIERSYSIDPASFVDDDGEAYLYFGGIWGGQRKPEPKMSGLLPLLNYPPTQSNVGPPAPSTPQHTPTWKPPPAQPSNPASPA